MPKKALITGITGQDGSYLTELLLDKGYEVHGIKRRSASPNEGRIDGIKTENFQLHYGDMTDATSLIKIVREVQPDEVYNLAAMSHVKTSFEVPEYTAQTDAIGVLRLLEAIKILGLEKKTRFYQASTSELFSGRPEEAPQSEATPFCPQSPYGVAKLYGFYITRVYRNSYNMFACNGLLFNHESVPAWTPMLIRKDGLLDLLPIEEVVPNFVHKRSREINDIEVWEDGKFVRVTLATAYPHNSEVLDKGLTEIEARSGFIEATQDHIIFTQKGEVKAGEIEQGSELLESVHYPEPLAVCKVTPEWACFLGIFVGDGYAGWSDGKFVAQIRSDNKEFLEKAAEFWRITTGGGFSFSDALSGFTGKRKKEGFLRLYGAPGILEWLARACYVKSRHKRIPKLILNAGLETWREFLKGYNMADGLKAGHGTYEFKNFKTNSPTLASQLMWMTEKALNQRTVLNVDRVYQDEEEYRYFSIDLNSPNQNQRGSHLKRNRNEIKRICPVPHRGWLFDLTTETGRFAAGVGNLLIHNSPRRGENFVTRKITLAAARISLGLQEKLYLGNLNAKRDWGHAFDYTEAMWLMLQQDRPDDYVIATGEAHSVREFCEIAFQKAGIDLEWQGTGVEEKGMNKKTGKVVVEVSPEFFRPAEVQSLLGDASKAKRELGWSPKISFEELVEEMVQSDLEKAKEELCLKKANC